MDSKTNFKVLGIMSGTSLDGVDLALCQFKLTQGKWKFSIDHPKTISYPATWFQKLSLAHTLSGASLIELDVEYGSWLGKISKQFLTTLGAKVDFIASHGHTVFHQPKKGYTYQIGNGTALSVAANLPVIYDFRSLDVFRGGEGAPLVPIGDQLLFSDYDICLNLGGIANISMQKNKERIAYDVCYFNMGLNYLAQQAGKKYDASGKLAASGEVNKTLLQSFIKLNKALQKKRPSLSREMFENDWLPLLKAKRISLADRLCTFTEAAAIALRDVFTSSKGKVLCTGGGTLNAYFITRLLEHCGDDAALIIPEPEVIHFKEALVFAFLGVLRYRGEVNCLKSVTHASHDSSSGVMVGF
jgi:anhydro-N-acetylmuramic acid kinase